MKEKWKSESGQSAVLFAVILTALIGVLALVIDFGRPALVARRLQNAADSAALAGASLLPVGTYEPAEIQAVKDCAVEYANQNGFSDVSVSLVVLFEATYERIDVTVKETVEYTFAKIFGLDSTELERSASAQVFPVTSMRGVVPLSVTYDELYSALQVGNYYLTLKYGGGSGTNGAYGALNLDGEKGGGASQYRHDLINGYDGTISVGDQVPTENGNMSGPTVAGVQQRYSSCTHYASEGGCTPEHYDPSCSRIMMIPVVRYIDKHEVEIVGFAPFLLDSCTGSGNMCFVYGTYLENFHVADGDTDWGNNLWGTPITAKLVG